MKGKKIILIATILIVSLLSFSLVGCAGSKDKLAKGIRFSTLSEDEINYNHLEKSGNDKVALVENKIPQYKVANVTTDSRSFNRAMDELVATLSEVGNTTFERVNVENNDISGLIYINQGKIANMDSVENDGFAIEIKDEYIAIDGKTLDATRNGIYYFLEEYLGVVFVSPEDTFVPTHDNIYLDKGIRVYNPATAWRGMYAYETADNYWASKLLLNSIDVESTDSEIEADIIAKEANNTKLADKDRYINQSKYDQKKKINENRNYNEWGTWCHSMYEYLSPEEYFDTHPEYFSMYKGERTHYYGGIDAHLCLSNEEVYQIVERSLGEKIAAHPEVKYWDFSANDNWHIRGCECDKCKALDRAAGGTGMGTLLPFINRLADKYPDVCISTLAYTHNLKAPTNGIKPRSNVVIKLCAMPGDQASTYLDPKNNDAKLFYDQMKEWSAITDKIVVWDYTVNFANLLMPFPNLAVQQDNQRFYEENNIQGVFHQSSREQGGELSTLRAYTLAKLMWTGSSLDYAKTVSRYVHAYYGDAASEVIAYLNNMQRALSDSSPKLGLYDRIASHINGYLSSDNIDKYERNIEHARAKVVDQPKYIDRVEELELNVLYAKIQLPDIGDDERAIAIDRLRELASKQGITMSQEWQSLDVFIDHIDDEINATNNAIARPRNIALGVTFGTAGVLAIATLIAYLIIRKRSKNDINIDKIK